MKKQIEIEEKLEAVKNFKNSRIQEYMEIEEKKFEINKLECQLDEKYIDIIEKITSRITNNIIDCSICVVNEANTAVIPYGHKFFCYKCIDMYNKMYPCKGCPICINNNNLILIYFVQIHNMITNIF